MSTETDSPRKGKPDTSGGVTTTLPSASTSSPALGFYVLTEEDAFEVAKEKRIGKKRVRERIDSIRKGVEDGFAYNWHDVVEGAIDEAMKDS